VGIGGCILLIAVGAVLTFAVNWHMPGMNVHVAGLIVMLAGVIGLLAFISIYKRRLPPPPTGEHHHVGDRPEGFVEERRYYD